MKNILVLNGHPDPSRERLCAALAGAYAQGASAAGHQIRRIDVGALDFPLIRSFEDFARSEPPQVIKDAQACVAWADHILLVHPLWLGGAPAVLKAFLEQVFRYGFAVSPEGRMKGLLTGKSVRSIVTMGMPAPVFRWVFGAHGLKAVERGIFWVSGLRPIRRTLLGGADGGPHARWLQRVERLGWQAA